jgi:hypothetical protein
VAHNHDAPACGDCRWRDHECRVLVGFTGGAVFAIGLAEGAWPGLPALVALFVGGILGALVGWKAGGTR